MIPVSSLSKLILGLLGSWQILLFWTAVYILVVGFRDRRRINPVIRNILILLLCFANYALFQFTIGHLTQNAGTAIMIGLVDVYSHLPVVVILAVCIILTASEIYLIISMRRWYDTHITSASIKETIETLPVGLCAFEPSGKIILRNTTMEQLSRSLTGQPLLNGNEFVGLLTQKNELLSDFAVNIPDFSVWSFEKDEISDGNSVYTLLVAYNVTEAYQKTQILAERQKTVQELNEKLMSYNREIEQVITGQEVLNAKVRIHDELGLGLLAIKRYLVSGGSDDERDKLLEHLKGNIKFLQQEAVSKEQDEYSLILSTARNLDVSVKISGMLPQTEPNKHIIATAIHECFTNIIRHTDGDTLFVCITEEDGLVTALFTDNNKGEVGEIAETGGLGSLRDLVERSNGAMNITMKPHFCLTITLPKEVTEYGL